MDLKKYSDDNLHKYAQKIANTLQDLGIIDSKSTFYKQ